MADHETDRNPDVRGGQGVRGLAVGAALFVVILAVVLVVTQLEKWTCDPPDAVWVESADNCQELP